MLSDILYEYFQKSDNNKSAKVFKSEDTVHFNPSSFSACKKQIYLKKRYVAPSNPIDSLSYMKMDMGTTIHTRIQEIVKKQGILLEAEKLKTVKFQGLDFRYKIDGKIVLNRQRHIMEIKTTSGGGMRVVKYDPKPADVIQLSLYMLFENIQNGVLVYVGRDNGYIIEYFITQECDAYRAAIAEIGRKIPELKQLEIQIKQGIMPKRDGYIEMKNSGGKISENFQKDRIQHKSDWRCSYCQWKNLCWKDELEEIDDHKFYLGSEFVD
jgi:CRISPR/Cas system-associated exonuclease Cas4 (RecB family)